MALPRVRAPELRGAGGWIDVERLSLAELRTAERSARLPGQEGR